MSDYSIETVKEKLGRLADAEGFDDPLSMIEEYNTDSIVPGICMSADCDGYVDIEPDSRDGWCPVCEGNEVWSCLELFLEVGEDI